MASQYFIRSDSLVQIWAPMLCCSESHKDWEDCILECHLMSSLMIHYLGDIGYLSKQKSIPSHISVSGYRKLMFSSQTLNNTHRTGHISMLESKQSSILRMSSSHFFHFMHYCHWPKLLHLKFLLKPENDRNLANLPICQIPRLKERKRKFCLYLTNPEE